jgi:hypothetical protein
MPEICVYGIANDVNQDGISLLVYYPVLCKKNRLIPEYSFLIYPCKIITATGYQVCEF